ncbi:MAG: serine/threonine protein kinase, partial [Planctomycetes bacterium]|nr:serine/threonine protein kinase [Planctomycetota bacterium]
MARRPTQIGPYPLLGVLGEGGMGSVYLSKHPQLGCEVALKVMSAGRRATPAQRKRFEREVRTLRQLRHPGLVELLDAGEDKGVPWLAMRRVPGETLGDLFRSRAGFSAGEAVDLGVQVTSALVPAHALGILHRDLKPDNVIRTPEGRYVVTDFGLTKELDRDESVRLSQTGAVQGTPGYWAPEQASGTQGDWDARTDVYGVGALLYAALTGVPPIQGEGMVEIMIATENRVPVPPSELTREPVPAELDRIVLTCLEKSRGDRYESLELLRNDLLAFGEGTPPPTVRGGAWVPLALSGLLLLLLLPLGFFTARATDSAPSKAGSPLATSTASSPAADVQPSALYQRARRAL